MSHAQDLVSLIEDSEGWKDLAGAPGVHPAVRRMYRAWAMKRRADARKLARAYVPRAKIRGGEIVIPFPIGAPERRAVLSPRDFVRSFVDVHH